MNNQDLLGKVATLLALLPWRIVYLGGSKRVRRFVAGG